MVAKSGGKAGVSSEDGRIDSLTGDLLSGWYFHPLHRSQRFDLDVVIDDILIGQTRADRFREDLLRDGKGDGAHAFVFKIPDRFFDGGAHNIYVRLAGTSQGLRRAIRARRLVPDQLPQRRGAILSIGEDGIVGYTLDERDPSRAVRVDVVRNGAVVGTVAPMREIKVNGVSAGEFIVPGAAAFGNNPFKDELSLVFFGTRIPLENPIGDLAAAAVSIRVIDSSGSKITGIVRVPGRVDDGDMDLHLCVGDDLTIPLLQPEWRNEDSEFGFTFGIDATHRSRDVPLSVRTSSGRLLGRPMKLSLVRRENLLLNPSFDEWSAAGPLRWDIPDPLRALAIQGYASQSNTGLSLNGGTTGHTLVLRLKESAHSGPIVSQDFDLSGLGSDTTRVDILAVSKASEPTELRVILRVEEETGTTHEVVGSLTAWTSWGRGALRLILPKRSEKFRPRATLSIASPIALPEVLQFALLMLGPAGFRTGPLEEASIRDLTAKPLNGVNAVVNGDFARWNAPLEQILRPGANVDCADDWTVKSRARSDSVRVSLDRISVRNPAKAVTARLAYGVELSGNTGGGSVRLETELDMLALGRDVSDELSFFVKTSQVGSSISKVLILQAEALDFADGEEARFSEHIILNVSNRIDLNREGGYLTFKLGAAKAAELKKLARRNIGNPKMKFLLGIDLDGVIDCRIADVYFGPRERLEPSQGEGPVLQFEDSRIASQLSKLKLFDGWRVTQRVEPGAARPEPVRAGIKWSRRSRDVPSIDIVVCVYNALDEVLNCLDSIISNTTVPYTLTIIDDGSAPSVGTALAAFAAGRPWIRVKTNSQNLGYTRSANIGLAGSDAEWVILLNSDTIVTPGWVEGMLECAQSDPAIRFVGPLSNAASWQSIPEVKDAAGRWMVNQLPEGMTTIGMAKLVGELSLRNYPRVPLLNGFCTMMDYRTLEELGFLDEQAFPLGYGEENDICIRAGKAGYKLAIADDVYIFHSKSASFGTSQRQTLSRQGNHALASKHPDTDIKVLEAQLATATPINDLRGRIKAALQRLAVKVDERNLSSPSDALQSPSIEAAQ